MFVQSFARILEDVTAYSSTNTKTNLTRRIEYVLKPSNYDAKPWFSHFIAQRSKFPRRFREIWTHATLEVHHVFQRHIPHLRRFILHQTTDFGGQSVIRLSLGRRLVTFCQ